MGNDMDYSAGSWNYFLWLRGTFFLLIYIIIDWVHDTSSFPEIESFSSSQEIPCIHENRNLVTVLTKTLRLPLSWTR
jgi:hypothetical protein